MSLHAFGTHQPVLFAAALNSRGALIELGSGFYSTPFLHAVSMAQSRSLTTVDTSRMYANFMSRYNKGLHRVMLLDDELMSGPSGKFEDVNGRGTKYYVDRQQRFFEQHLAQVGEIGLVFVDHDPGFLRQPALEWFAGRSQYIIAHDAESARHYGYDWSGFKYRYHDRSQPVETVCVSNSHSCDWVGEYLWSRGSAGGEPIIVPPNLRTVELIVNPGQWASASVPAEGLKGSDFIRVQADVSSAHPSHELQIMVRSKENEAAYFWKSLIKDGVRLGLLEDDGVLTVEMCSLGLVGNLMLAEADEIVLRFRADQRSKILLDLG